MGFGAADRDVFEGATLAGANAPEGAEDTAKDSKRKWGKLEVESEYLLGEQEEDGGGGHGSTGGSIWGSTFNLCNSAIGAGILALPYAVKEAGLVLGMICMICMCLTLAFTLKILVWTNRLHPEAKSYEKLVLSLFGARASILVTFSVILTTFGACTGFLVIIADLLPPIVELMVGADYEWVYSRITVALVVSIFGILPLASLKNFNSLRFSSTMAIVSVTFTVFVVVFRSAQHFPLSETTKSQINYFNFDFGVFDALPLISFAFGCHMQLIPIYGELKDKHIPSRANMVIFCTNTVCIVLYSLTGIFGYLNFPTSNIGNVLKNYPGDDVLVNVARAALCFVIVCHYPPSNYCCRAALEYLIFKDSKPSTFRRLGWTFLIWAGALIVSIAIPEIDVVFGLIGATANSLIVFIFPALFLIFCNQKYNWSGISGPTAKLIGFLILGMGVTICLVGTVVIVLNNWFKDVICKEEHC